MRRYVRQPRIGGVLLNYLPNHLLGDPIAPDMPAAIDRPPHASVLDARTLRPQVERDLDPCRHRNGTQPPALADQVGEHPTAVALLDMFDRKLGQLAAAECAAKEHGQDGPVALPLDRGGIGRAEKTLSLLERQPVAQAHAEALSAFYAADASRQIGIKQAVVSGFQREFADRAQPDVDRGSGEAVALQLDAERLHGGLG